MTEENSVDSFLAAFEPPAPPTEYTFYDDTESIFYDDTDGKHFYFKWVCGVQVQVHNVTSIVDIIDKSPALMQWTANQTVQCVAEKLLAEQAQFDKINFEVGLALTPKMFSAEEISAMFNEARFHYKTTSKTALDVGRLAHNWLEEKAKAQVGSRQITERMPKNKQARRCCVAACRWWKAHNYRPLCIERKIYSRQYGYAGTMDNMGWIDGCGDESCCGKFAHVKGLFIILDWKSSRAHYVQNRLQLAAYLEAIFEELGMRAAMRWCIRLGKDDGKVDPKFYDESTQTEDFGCFINALGIVQRLKQVDADKKSESAEKKEAKKAAKLAEKEAKAVAKAAVKAEKEETKLAAKNAKLAAKAEARANA
jgi:hypothetical protein